VTIVVGYTRTPAGRAALTTATGREAADELIDGLEEVGAELCVIGIRRRSAVGKMLLGSNAHRILMDSPCPVLTVPAA
jgi:nucleotide-binding universal stress UspA family protein